MISYKMTDGLGTCLYCFLFGHFNGLKAGLIEPTLPQLELI